MDRPVSAPLRVGLIGVGWGALVQAPAFHGVDGYELVGVCARRQERAEAAAKALEVDLAVSDWESFVRRDDIDVVSVASPAELHHDMTLAALAAGKHVLCEKPLAASARDAEAMCAAAEASGAATAICFELRYQRDRDTVRGLVDDGVVGHPYFVRMSQSAHYWHPSRPLQALWMYDVEAGGGYLANMVVHDIDWVCSMFGDPVEVCADVRASLPERERAGEPPLPVTADDTDVLVLRMASGALAVLTSSVVGVHTAGYRLDIFGEAGTIIAERSRTGAVIRAGRASDPGLAETALTTREPGGLADLPPGRGSSNAIRAMGLLLESWLPAFSGEATGVPSFVDGLRAQRVIDAARQSSAGAGWVRLS
jgi:predicted dehydrogenase